MQNLFQRYHFRVDPDNQLNPSEKQQFINLHKGYDYVFNPNFGAYNDFSGKIHANINIGPVIPPPRKGKLPFYNQSTLCLLQKEADKLEALGVLAKPEHIGADVKFTSPSFLVKKPSGGYWFVTAFNELGQYAGILPTVLNSCAVVLCKLS